MKNHLIPFLSLVGLLAIGCSTEKDHLVTIETRHGNMYAVLHDETPKHKENFLKLAKAGRYDSTEFHRVIKDFMAQAGDVFGKEELPEEEWYTLPSEFNTELIHEKGSIAAARQGDNINPERRSSGSQFYIVRGKVYDEKTLNTDMRKLQEAFMKYIQLESKREIKERYTALYEKEEYDSLTIIMLDQKEDIEEYLRVNLDKKMRPEQVKAYTTTGGTPHLDDTYTVFGKVIKGLEVLDKIVSEETDRADKPKNPVWIKVNVKELDKKKITKDYGYEYKEK
ncbi:peptidylprolyl isomerase [Pleomorphovibrio marinus]|uniref:peptidylprolyl isomerase n=1 Tax=Pleomorphovibrio marinus TaxID=2164132 RepID=UPI000E0C25FC|nr:peptidylprolyl isomerase [Pleomorphovibrio marinus]